MELFYARPEQIKDERILCDDFERKHILQALRKSEGDMLQVTDGRGGLYQTKLLAQKPQLVLSIVSHKKMPAPIYEFCLAMGFIRPSRLEFALEKGAELGVTSFALLRSAYANYSSGNTARYEKILRQAIKQSLRYYLPGIEVFQNLQSFFDKNKTCELKIAAIDNKYPPLSKTLAGKGEKEMKSVCMLVGPEGGFSEAEIANIASNGFKMVSLGQNRLRAETAAISATAQIQQILQY